jgi:hypothetical protein
VGLGLVVGVDAAHRQDNLPRAPHKHLTFAPHLDGDPDAVSRLSDLLLALTPAPGAAALRPTARPGGEALPAG